MTTLSEQESVKEWGVMIDERDAIIAAKDAEIARIMAAVGKIEELLEIPEDERGFDFGTINRAITSKAAEIAALKIALGQIANKRGYSEIGPWTLNETYSDMRRIARAALEMSVGVL